MALPTVGQFNNNFMAKNPQYGNTANTASAINGMASSLPSAIPPVGQKAASPAANIKPAPTALPTGQAAPAAPKNTGTIGSPSALAGNNTSPTTLNIPSVYGTATTGLANIGTGGDSPEVAAARDLVQRLSQQQGIDQTNLAGRPNPFGYASSLSDLSASRYGTFANAAATNLQNALTSQGQRIGALGSAGGLTSPTQVSPGNFYVSPETGKDITGGTISPFSGGVRQAQVVQGGQYQNNLPILSTAKAVSGNLSSLINSANLNSNDLNAANWLQNVYASNTSNPLLPQIQSTFNNVIQQYAKVLGEDPNTLISNLLSTSKGATINSLLANLDYQANTYNNNLQGAGTGQAASPVTPPPTAPQRIRVQIGNQTGTIDPSEFNASTMTRI